jgi:hypothetical protein
MAGVLTRILLPGVAVIALELGGDGGGELGPAGLELGQSLSL